MDLNKGKAARIRHTYKEKQMAFPLVFNTRSAYKWKAKIVMLGEKVNRRIMNMDRSHTEIES